MDVSRYYRPLGFSWFVSNWQRRGIDTPVRTLMEMFLSLIVWHGILLMTLVAALYRVLKGSLFRTLNLMRTGGRVGVCAKRTSAHPGVVLHYVERCRGAEWFFYSLCGYEEALLAETKVSSERTTAA